MVEMLYKNLEFQLNKKCILYAILSSEGYTL